jgi:predicted DNA-binding transcriptional regulator YafY
MGIVMNKQAKSHHGEDRRRRIVERLQSAAGSIPGKLLAHEMGCTPRTLMFDIATLREQGHDIASSNSPFGGYRLNGKPVDN